MTCLKKIYRKDCPELSQEVEKTLQQMLNALGPILKTSSMNASVIASIKLAAIYIQAATYGEDDLKEIAEAYSEMFKQQILK